MISLDQVLLLEEKVESAVAKIQQLEAENDALRNKCSELTNALSAKTEQLASFENEQKTIESGIIKAIDRLNSIENSVLKQAGQSAPKPAASGLAASAAAAASKVATPTPVEEAVEAKTVEAPAPTPTPTTDVSFDQMTPVDSQEEETFDEEEVIDNPDAIDQAFDEVTIEEPIEDETDTDSDPESKDQLGFDIF